MPLAIVKGETSKVSLLNRSGSGECPAESDDRNWRSPEGEEEDKINLSSILGIFFNTEKKRAFEPQVLIEKIRNEKKYFRNATWETQYHLLRCHSQPFLTRITLNGEFYSKP